MINIKKRIGLCFFILFSWVITVIAQKIELEKGYYINNKKETITGYFDLEYLKSNKIYFNKDNTPKSVSKLDISTISVIVLDRGLTIQPINITANKKEETIYIYTIIAGKINLFQGFSNENEEIFFINCDDIPNIKRINKTDPQTFLYTYFKSCNTTQRRDIWYNTSSLKSAITMFGECYKPDIQNLKLSTTYKTAKLDIGIKPSLMLIKSKSTGWFEGEYKGFLSAGISLAVRINFSSFLSFNTGFTAFSKKLTPIDTFKTTYYNVNYTPYPVSGYPVVKYHFFEMPFGLNYHFKSVLNGFKPVVGLGGSLIATPNRQLISGDFQDKTLRVEKEIKTLEFRKTSVPKYSLYLSAAVNKKMNDKSYFEFGTKYSRDFESMLNILAKGADLRLKTLVKSNRLDLFFTYYYSIN